MNEAWLMQWAFDNLEEIVSAYPKQVREVQDALGL